MILNFSNVFSSDNVFFFFSHGVRRYVPSVGILINMWRLFEQNRIDSHLRIILDLCGNIRKQVRNDRIPSGASESPVHTGFAAYAQQRAFVEIRNPKLNCILTDMILRGFEFLSHFHDVAMPNEVQRTLWFRPTPEYHNFESMKN